MTNHERSRGHITNSKATSSLVFGILSIVLPFIGLVLGILGIIFSRNAKREIAKTNEAGEGLATAGLICSVVGLATQVLAVIGLIGFIMLSAEIMHQTPTHMFP